MYWKMNKLVKRTIAGLLAALLVFSGSFAGNLSGFAAFAEEIETAALSESNIAENAGNAANAEGLYGPEEEELLKATPSQLLGAAPELKEYTGSKAGFSETATISINDCCVINLARLEDWGLTAYEAKSASTSLKTSFRGYKLSDVLTHLGIPVEDIIYLACRNEGNNFPVALDHTQEAVETTLLAFESKTDLETTWHCDEAVYVAPLMEEAGKSYIKNAEDIRVAWNGQTPQEIESNSFENKKIVFKYGNTEKEVWTKDFSSLTAWEVVSSKEAKARYGVSDSYRGYILSDVLEYLGYTSFKSVKVTNGSGDSITLSYDEYSSDETLIACEIRSAEAADKAQKPGTGNGPYLAVCASTEEERYFGNVTEIEVLTTANNVTVLENTSGFSQTASFSINDCSWVNYAKLSEAKLTAYEVYGGNDVYYRGYQLADVLEACGIDPEKVTSVSGRTSAGSGVTAVSGEVLKNAQSIIAFEKRTAAGVSTTEACTLAFCADRTFYTKLQDLRVVYPHTAADKIEKPEFSSALSVTVNSEQKSSVELGTALQAYEIAAPDGNGYRGYLLADVLSLFGYASSGIMTVNYGSGASTALSEDEVFSGNAMLAFQIRKSDSAKAGQAPETGSAVYLVTPEAASPLYLDKVSAVTLTAGKSLTVLSSVAGFSTSASLTLNDAVKINLAKLRSWGLTAYEAKSARTSGESYQGYKLRDILNAAGIRLSEIELIGGRVSGYTSGGSTGIISLSKRDFLANGTLVAFAVKDSQGKVSATDGLVLAPTGLGSAESYYGNVEDIRVEYPYDEIVIENPSLGSKGVTFNGKQLIASQLSGLTAYEVRSKLDGNTYRGYKLKDVLKLKGYQSADSLEVTYANGGSSATCTLTSEEINDDNTVLAFEYRIVTGDNPQKPERELAVYLACCSSEDSTKYFPNVQILKLPIRNDVILCFTDLDSVTSDLKISIVEGFGDSYAKDDLELEAHPISGNSLGFDLPAEGNYTAVIHHNGYRALCIPFGYYDGKVTSYLKFKIEGTELKYEMQYSSEVFKDKTFFIQFTDFSQNSEGAWDQKTLDLNWYKEYDRNSENPVFEISKPEEFAGLAAIVNGLYSADITTIKDNDTTYTPQEYAKLSTRKIRPVNATELAVEESSGITWYGTMSSGVPSDFNGATIKLTADIDMGAGYMPIGGTYAVNYSLSSNYWDFSAIIDSGFAGVLDGQGHTVNYNFRRVKNATQGFFIFQGLGLVGLLGNDDETIAASIENPGVKNLIVTGSVYSCRSLAGVVGRLGKTSKDVSGKGNGSTVENVVNLASVTGTDKKGTCGIVGGGYNEGLILNAANFGRIINDGGSDFQANGIVGYNAMTLRSVYNIGTVSNALSDDYARAISSDDTSDVDVYRAFWLSGSAPSAVYDLGGEKEVTEIASLSGFQTEDFREQLETNPGDWIILTESNKDHLITKNGALVQNCMNMPMPATFFKGIYVAYEMNDASSIPTKFVESGSTVSRPANPSAAGYDFVDFYKDSAFTEVFDYSKPITEKTIIYAKWVPHTYTVSFVNSEGTVSSGSKEVTMGSLYGELPTAEKTGGTFLGWYTQPTGGKKVTEKTKVMTAANHTLYAQFETARYRVTLETNGGTINGEVILRYIYGKGMKLPTDVTKSGYIFSGWYSNASFSGSAVTEISATDSGDKTFYARFTTKSSGGGGSSSGGSSSGGSSGGGGGGGGTATVKSGTATTATYCDKWFTDEKGIWKIKNSAGQLVTSAWLCDNAILTNGQNVWYLLNTDGSMLAAGLIQDNTGNFYSLETTHNGYYGSLRYKNGTYDCNGQQVYLEFSQNHDGTFGKILNADGLEKLQKIYGVTRFGIDNNSCTYTATF